MGLIGGGGAGFIGRVHVTAATLDREAELVSGALSSDPVRARDAAKAFRIDPSRAYGSFQELLEAEIQRPAKERIDFVSIATPNHTHADIACAALEAGLHVVCDKPMTTTLTDAERLVDAVQRSGRVFALTHNYSGYPMVRQAREIVAAGDLGEILAVRVCYIQGWMHGMNRDQVPARGAWKSDPEKNGRAGSLGDVGTHAFHLLRFVTGLKPTALISRMHSYSGHHDLDDYGHTILRLEQDATGLVTWSQVSHGRLNDLSIEVDGSKASLSWRQEEPNQLIVRSLGLPTRTYERNPNASYMATIPAAACRLPGGHPEAFFEAFANVYRDAFREMRRASHETADDDSPPLYPTVQDGWEGVRFMHRCLESNDQNSAWCSW
jgi:predicted dehydrogenase